MTLKELREKHRTAMAKYNSCGCKKYKEEADGYARQIKDLEKQISNG